MAHYDVTGCVFPVSAADALLWAEGRLHDRDLLLDSPLVPEAVFFLELPGIHAYRDCVEAALYWQDRGACCLIARTATPTVLKHMIRFGSVPLWVEWHAGHREKTRFFVPPDVFKRWLAHK